MGGGGEFPSLLRSYLIFMFAVVLDSVKVEGACGIRSKRVVDCEMLLILGNHKSKSMSACFFKHHFAQIMRTVDTDTINVWCWVN